MSKCPLKKKTAHKDISIIQNAGLLEENKMLRRLLMKAGEKSNHKAVKKYIDDQWGRKYKGFFKRRAKKNGWRKGKPSARIGWSYYLKNVPKDSYLHTLKPHKGKKGPLRFLIVAGGGGLGDALMYTPLLTSLKKKFWPCEITVYYQSSIINDLASGQQLVDHVIQGDWVKNMNGIWPLEEIDIFDMIIFSPCFFPRLVPCRDSRLKSTEHKHWIMGNNTISELLERFSTNFGSNLLDQILQVPYLDIMGRLTGLDINEASPILYAPDPAAIKTIDQYKLPLNFITVRDGANKDDMLNAKNIGKNRTNKQITEKKWASIVNSLKKKGLYVVQVGADHDPHIKNVDLDLRSKTTLSELCFLMKRSIVHIDTEGGLVHFARASQKESIVMFGTTSPTFFGYPQNENLYTSNCAPCFYSDYKWVARCPRGTKGPECAINFEHESIINRTIKLYTEKKKERFVIERTSKSSDKNIEEYITNLNLTGIDIAYIGNSKFLNALAPKLQKLQKLHAVFSGEKPDIRDNKSTDKLGKWLRKTNTTATYGAIWNIPLNSYAFQTVICPKLITLTERPDQAITELLRLIPKGGKVIVTIKSNSKWNRGEILTLRSLQKRLRKNSCKAEKIILTIKRKS